jgi:hypothetical protein
VRLLGGHDLQSFDGPRHQIRRNSKSCLPCFRQKLRHVNRQWFDAAAAVSPPNSETAIGQLP